MSALRSALVLLAAVPLLVSCTGTDVAPSPTAPGPATVPLAQRQDAVSGSASGAVVERTSADQGFLAILDAESGLGFTLGLTSSLATYCATGVFTSTPSTVQTVSTPSGNDHFLVRVRDASIVVYDYTGGAPSLDPCDLVGRPVLATGTGGLTQTGLPPEGYAAEAHGTVTLIGGGRAQLTATEHYRPVAGGAPVVRSVVKLTGPGVR